MTDKSNNSIDTMIDKFKTVDDLKAYANAQYKTLIALNKQMNVLKKENQELLKKVADGENLKNMLSGPVDGEASPFDSDTDEETICLVQLKFLKSSALERELTMEETRKVETLIKSLAIIRNRPKPSDDESNIKDMSSEELLNAMSDVMKTEKQ